MRLALLLVATSSLPASDALLPTAALPLAHARRQHPCSARRAAMRRGAREDEDDDEDEDGSSVPAPAVAPPPEATLRDPSLPIVRGRRVGGTTFRDAKDDAKKKTAETTRAREAAGRLTRG